MRYTEITEARRNKTVNRKESAMQALEKYRGQDDIFVSYTIDVGKASQGDYNGKNTSGHKIGINPKSHYRTPLAIYTYPIAHVLGTNGDVEFQSDAPFIQVVRVKPEANIWYLTQDDDRAWKKMYGRINLEIAEEYGPDEPHELDYDDDDEYEEAMAEYESFSPLGRAFDRVASLKAAKALRDMGYDGVADLDGLGIIHSNEPTQAFFLSKAAFTHVETIRNISPVPSPLRYASIYTRNRSSLQKFYADLRAGKVPEETVIDVLNKIFNVISMEDFRELKLPESLIQKLRDPLNFKPASHMEQWFGYLEYPPALQREITTKYEHAYRYLINPDSTTTEAYVLGTNMAIISWETLPMDMVETVVNKRLASNLYEILTVHSPRALGAILPETVTGLGNLAPHAGWDILRHIYFPTIMTHISGPVHLAIVRILNNVNMNALSQVAKTIYKTDKDVYAVIRSSLTKSLISEIEQ